MKKVLITGATRGIGKAVLQNLSAAGNYELAFCARNSKELDLLTAKLQEQVPKIKVLAEKCDVSDPDQIKKWCMNLRKSGFFPEVLINNAGVFVQDYLTEEPEGTLNMLLNTNLLSAYHLTREWAPEMKKLKKGHIINMCSTASMRGFATSGAYCVSKHALLGLSRSLREELKPFNIRVTSILPGSTLTASWENTNLPPERFINPNDVASAVRMAIESSGSTVVEDIVLRPLQGDFRDQ